MSEQNEKAPAVPKKRRSVCYEIARVIYFLMFHSLSPLIVRGRENIPATDKGYMIIGNHKSLADPFIIGSVVKKRQIIFLGKKELTSNALVRAVLKEMNMITVDRHNMDMAAMRSCTKALRDNEILGIFPEGTRHHTGLMDELEGGTAMIALRSGCPLIPVLITPKYRIFHRTWCIIGEPIPTEDLRAQGINAESCQRLLERITATYQGMMERFQESRQKKI